MSCGKYRQEDIAYKYDQKIRDIAEVIYKLCSKVVSGNSVNKKALINLQNNLLKYHEVSGATEYNFEKEAGLITDISDDEKSRNAVLGIKTKTDKIIREIIYTSDKFLDSPPPDVIFMDHKFVLTGCFLLVGSKDEAVRLIKERGGIIKSGKDKLNFQTDYLVAGIAASKHYKHENYGTKLEYVEKVRESESSKLKVISEAHFIKFIN